MNAIEWPKALGWVDVPQGAHAGGRYYLLDSFEWAGADKETVDFLNSAYSPVAFPSSGGMRPGAAQVAALAGDVGATSTQLGPGGAVPGTDTEGKVY